MSYAVRSVCLLLWAASCAPEPTTTTEELLTHAQQLRDDSIILFSHDHVRTADHFNDARTGGVTAMVMELIVDNWYWRDSNGYETIGPVGSSASGNPIYPEPSPGVIWQEPMSNAILRYGAARTNLMSIIEAPGSGFRLIRTVEHIDQAKAYGELGIIIGTEGTFILGDNTSIFGDNDLLARINDRHMEGWRKALLFRSYKNPFVEFSPDTLSERGRRLVPMLNKRGVVIDAMHLYPSHIDDLIPRTNAPLIISHDWNVCGQGYATTAPGRQEAIASTGGGHGVIALNVLTDKYSLCGHSPTIAGFVDTLVELISRVGVDHVGIGPDYMPEGVPSSYALPATPTTPPTPIPLDSLIMELLSRNDPATGVPFTDEAIKKIIGGNLRELYQRTWDPTHGYAGGAATFQLCSNTDPDPACDAARKNGGLGDLRHRAISCAHPSGLTPVGSQIAYRNNKWVFKNLAGAWVDCANTSLNANGTTGTYPGSTLVVSWGDPGATPNTRIALHGTGDCGPDCEQAINVGGAGTKLQRALNCQTAAANGIVGLQLVYTSNAWHHYNLAGQLVPCVGNSTLIADWGQAGNSNTNLRMCEDHNDHPACAAAASYAGNGTAEAKALSCLTPSTTWNPTLKQWEGSSVALQVFYSDMYVNGTIVAGGGHWQYWDTDFQAHPCLHGSVLVATTL